MPVIEVANATRAVSCTGLVVKVETGIALFSAED